MTPLLSVRRLEAGYDKTKVLSGVDLDVQPGEFLSILGANGMGKSTFLRSIVGLCRVFGGEILLEGESLRGMPAFSRARLGISILHDDRKIFASQSVDDNLKLAARSLSRSQQRSERAFIYSMFPVLKDRINQQVRTMSGGEQQMVALSMCLIRQPTLLLLDEPSFGLSPRLVDLLSRAFQGITDRGIAIVLVEQNAGLAFSSAHRCFVMQSGRFTLSGTPEQLTKDPGFSNAYFGIEEMGAAGPARVDLHQEMGNSE